MNNQSNSIVTVNYFLDPGYIFLPKKPTIVSMVLGSCVSVCLYDSKRKVGGINHYQYPHTNERHNATAKYGNVSTITLIRMMLNDGSKRKHLEAQIVGGANHSEICTKNIGRQNIMIARKILAKERINIASEDVGGEKGRKIVFNTHTNEMAVMKVDKLRAVDWFPYENDRQGDC